MKIVILFLGMLILLGCDSMPVSYNLDKCMTPIWMSGTFKIVKVEELSLYLKNVSGGNDKIISRLDRGWNEVSCP
jgi:hypothetical protein